MSVKSDSSSIIRRRWQRRRKRTSSIPQPQLPTTYDESRNRVILGAATTLVICVVNFLNFRGYLQKNQSPRRSLLNDVVQHESMSQFIISVDDTASDHDLGILWQEPPFSPAVNKFYQCMGKQLTGKVGIEADGAITTSHIDVEEDWIDKMSKLAFMPTDAFALVKSGQVNDLQVITDQPIMAVKSLLSEKQRGRMLGLFRHPVEHMANQLYKIKAEEGQEDIPLLEWMANTTGTQITKESDMIVKKIVGVKPTDSVTITDLKVAMDFVRDYVVVGLMTEQEESLRRFNLAMGWDDRRKNLDCMTGIFDDEESSFEQEPVVAPNSREWNAIAKRTPLDMMLFSLIQKLFEEQYDIFNDFPEEEPSEDPVWWRDGLNSDTIKSHLAPVNGPFSKQEEETPFFWHVPRAGGSHLQDLYWCMNFTLANQVGGERRFNKRVPRHMLVEFQPWKAYGNEAKVINVDMYTRNGIVHAKSVGFLSEEDVPRADIIFSTQFYYTSVILFSRDHNARVFAFFRHPVERALSRFTSLKKSNKSWAHLSVDNWATHHTGEANWMVRQLVGKVQDEAVDIKDLELAKDVVRSKVIVGLLDKHQESLHRFNVLLGVDESDAKVKQCMQSHASGDTSYAPLKIPKGSPAYVTLMSVNFLDVMLYQYLEELFDSQESMFADATGV